MGFLVRQPVTMLVTFATYFVIKLIACFALPMSLLPSVTVPRVAIRISTRGASTHRLRGAIIGPLQRRLVRITGLGSVSDRAHSNTNVVHLNFSFNAGASLTFVRIGRGVSTTVGCLPGSTRHPGIVGTDTASVPIFCLGLALGGSDTCNGISRHTFLSLYRFTRGIVGHHVRRLTRITVISIANLIRHRLRVIPSPSGLTILKLSVRSVRGILTRGGIRPNDVAIHSNCCRCGVGFSALLQARRSIGNVLLQGRKHVVYLKSFYQMRVIPTGRGNISVDGNGHTIALTIVGRISRGVRSVGLTVGDAVSCFGGMCPSVSFDVDHGRARLLSCAVSGLRRGLSLNFLFVYVITMLFLNSVGSPFVVKLDVIMSVIVYFLFFCLFGVSLGVVSLSKLVLTLNVVVSDDVVIARGVSRCHRQNCSLQQTYIAKADRIVAPVLDSSLAAVTMFIPLVFVDNVTKTLFCSRTFSIAIKLLISCFANVVLLPILCVLICQAKLHNES